MDCSKTEVFLRELKRLAEKKDVSVKEMTIGNRLCVLDPGLWDNKTPIKIQEIVQKWSDEHPAETVLEHFKKILPNMVIFRALDGKERVYCCPDSLDSRISRNCDDSLCKKYSCGDCWNRPYKEAIRGSKE